MTASVPLFHQGMQEFVACLSKHNTKRLRIVVVEVYEKILEYLKE
jgi:hypothetical protein